MIESPMLRCQKFKADMENQGFKINPYDPCVANKHVKGTYLTVTWHVDDLKISHKLKKVVDDFVAWLDKTYSDENGKVTMTEGDQCSYLGMVLDYIQKGAVKIDMTDYVKKMIGECNSEVRTIRSGCKCPWNENLFTVDEKSKPLDKDKAEQFHTFVAKGLFLCMRARPDIQPAISFLCTRVQKPTQ